VSERSASSTAERPGAGSRTVAPTPPLLAQVVPAPGLWAMLALLAMWLGRALAPALLGSLSGADLLVEVVNIAGAATSQLAALLFVLLVIRLTLLLLASRAGVLTRLCAAVAGVTAVACTAISSTGVFLLHELWLVVLATAVGLTGVVAAGLGLRVATYRGPALILLLGINAGMVYAGARALGIASSIAASAWGYTLARGLSTLAWSFEVGAIGVALVWATTTGRVSAPRWIAVVLGLAAATALAWGDGSDQWFRTFLQRALATLEPQPLPLIPDFMRRSLALTGALAGGLTLVATHRPGVFRLLVVLAILARSSLESPLGGLFALCAALILLLSLGLAPLTEP
jgi:hypothetical protein